MLCFLNFEMPYIIFYGPITFPKLLDIIVPKSIFSLIIIYDRIDKIDRIDRIYLFDAATIAILSNVTCQSHI